MLLHSNSLKLQNLSDIQMVLLSLEASSGTPEFAPTVSASLRQANLSFGGVAGLTRIASRACRRTKKQRQVSLGQIQQAGEF